MKEEVEASMGAIGFPALYFVRDGTMSVAMSADDIEITNRYGLNRGIFQELRIIDHRGREFLVRKATKVGGVGPLGGWNLCFNQKIRVILDFAAPRLVPFEDIKALVLRSLNRWHGWSS
jgi:hypothetical protein